MLKKILLPTIFVILAYGFWVSPDFKQIAAGVAIFLFGMLFLEQGFQSFTGGVLERVLRKSTDKLWKSLSFGVISTTVMQSSSLVSVIAISFLSAGLIGLAAGIGIIFGANLGTTTGAWLVAGFGLKVKISAYAMPMLVFGVILTFQKAKVAKGFGYILAGLGFLFLGIHHMKEGFEAFKETIDLAEYAVAGYPGLLLFSLIGVSATVIMQSSHATLVLIITALAAGQITYENALALAIGANVGTTITAIIGSLSANEQGKRLALAHLIFNLVTGAIAIGLIHQFVTAVDSLSAYVGIGAEDYTLKLAMFHTLFNLTGIIVMLPFTNPLVRFLERLIKPRVSSRDEPRHLNMASIDFPETAVGAVRRETEHLFENAFDIMARAISIPPQEIASDEDLEQVIRRNRKVIEIDVDQAYNDSIKGIYSAIVAFISKASFSWEAEQSGELHWLRAAGKHLVEALKDVKHMHKNLKRYLASDNADVREEYDKIRLQVATILRQLNRASQARCGEDVMVCLETLRIGIDSQDDKINRELIRLIKEDHITPEMGTSLMNDSAYAYDVSSNLIELGKSLFISGRDDLTSEQRANALTEDELDEVAAEVKAQSGEVAEHG